MAIKITQIKDYVVEVEGKHEYIINEVVEFKNNTKGIVMKATDQRAFIARFEESIDSPLNVGDSIKPTNILKASFIQYTKLCSL